jgi:RimJ/RimL family protein N-acetyltransferase
MTAMGWPSVTLTPIERSDLAKLNAWQNDAGIRDLTMGYRGPVQTAVTEQWLESVRVQNLTSRILFAVRRDGVLRGICQLHSIDWPHRKAIFGLYIGDAEDRSAGLGYMASVLLLDYAFRSLDFERVMIEVIAPNIAAKTLYERLGFVREGAFRSAYLVDGARVDIELYGILKHEWRMRPGVGANALIYSSAA